jgi:hypothetical protein
MYQFISASRTFPSSVCRSPKCTAYVDRPAAHSGCTAQQNTNNCGQIIMQPGTGSKPLIPVPEQFENALQTKELPAYSRLILDIELCLSGHDFSLAWVYLDDQDPVPDSGTSFPFATTSWPALGSTRPPSWWVPDIISIFWLCRKPPLPGCKG